MVLVKTNQETKEVVGVKERGLKAHFKKHKTKYLTTASLVGVGAICYYLGARNSESNSNSKQMSIKNVIGKEITVKQIDNSVNTIIQGVSRDGYPGVVIYCPQLKKAFRSFDELAKHTELPPNGVSNVNKSTSKKSEGVDVLIF